MRTRKIKLAFLGLWLCVAGAGAAVESLAPGVKLFESRRYAEARKVFEPYAKSHPRDAEAAYYLGRTLFHLRHYKDGVEWLEKAVALAPRQAVYHTWLGRAYGQAAMEASILQQAGLAKKSKAAMEKAVELDPNGLDSRNDLVQYYLLAPGFMGGSVDKAREQAAEIRRRDLARGVEAFVIIHLNQKDLPAAEREVQSAIQKAPAEPRLRVLLASIYQSQEKWEAAYESLETVLKANPDNWAALYQAGRTGALSGKRLDRAEECLKRYLQHTPGYGEAPLANAHHRLGTVYERMGDKARARAEYQAALKLDPKLEDARKALGALK